MIVISDDEYAQANILENARLKNDIKDIEKENVRLRKALDKACNELVELDEITVQERESYCWNKEEWKEWCLQDD